MARDYIKRLTDKERLAAACNEYESALKKDSYIVAGSRPDILNIAKRYGVDHKEIQNEHLRRLGGRDNQ